MVRQICKPQITNDLLTSVNMNSLSERLHVALKEAQSRSQGMKINQAWLAKQVGITTPAISKWFNEGTKKIEGENLLKAASSLGVRPEWLASGHGEMRAEQNATPANPMLRSAQTWQNRDRLDDAYVFIPSLGFKLSDDNVVWEIDPAGPMQVFSQQWIDRMGIDPKCVAMIISNDNSMEPQIHDGDSVIVDYCQQNILDGKVYALALAGEVCIRRLLKEFNGSIRVVPDHLDRTHYPDKLIPANASHSLQVIGRVVAVSGRI